MLRLLLISLVSFALSCTNNNSKHTVGVQNSIDSIQVADQLSNIPPSAIILIKAYPALNLTYKDNHIIFPDGSSLLFDDGRERDFISKLDNADIDDMFSLKYNSQGTPTYLSDGGRCRCDSFFLKVYGGSKREVEHSLVTIDWFGQKTRISSVNGVDKQLSKVRDEISKIPELLRYMNNSSSYYWRYVRGSQKRLSAHSYGIAVDINTSYSDYWLWKNSKASETDKIEYQNRIPLQLVRIFEKYGFIWGGAWYHYDTMHFEYRPEILINAGITIDNYY